MVRITPFSICVVLGLVPLSVSAAPAPDVETAPAAEDTPATSTPDEALDRLVLDGGTAYNLGNFDAAIENFEAAYTLSLQPRLLYNLAVAHFRRYDITNVGADLQHAKALLTNFDIELQRDPTLGDSENVQRLIGQIDEKIAANAQQEQAKQQATLREEARQQAELADTAVECPVVAVEPAIDTTRDRPIGATLMGLGSVSFAAGIASITAFSLKGQEFKNKLAVFEAERAELGCSGSNPPPGCAAYDAPIAATITNGHRANVFAGAVGGTLTALGAAGFIAGAVVFTKSDKRPSDKDRRASVAVVPSPRGMVVVGRF